MPENPMLSGKAYSPWKRSAFYKKFLPCSYPHNPNFETLAEKNFIIRTTPTSCANRNMYRIGVTKTTFPLRRYIEPHEHLGIYDAIPNAYGEKVFSINVDRLLFWLSHGVQMDKPTAMLLGLAGLLPQHPTTYKLAWRNRREFLREEMERQAKDLEQPQTEEQKEQ